MTEKKKSFGERLTEARKKRLAKQFHGDYLSESDQFVKLYERGSKKEDSGIICQAVFTTQTLAMKRLLFLHKCTWPTIIKNLQEKLY